MSLSKPVVYPLPEQNNYRLLQLTDCHLLADPQGFYQGIQPYVHLQRLLAHCRDLPWDAVILTGDLTQDETLASYQLLAGLFEDWPCPVFYVPGNHDDVALMQLALAGAPFHAATALISRFWNFLLLNTKGPTPAGQFDHHRLQQLSTQLQAQQTPTWLFCHHHPWPIGSAIDSVGLTDAEFLLQLLAAHPQVKGLAHGHCHLAYQTLLPSGLQLVGCPATSVQFLRQTDWQTQDQGPQGCIWNFAADGSVQWEFIRL